MTAQSMRPFKSRSLAVVGLLAGIASVILGAVHYTHTHSDLQKRLSEDGYGYVLEQLHEPNQDERAAGRLALKQWESKPEEDRYQLAYDIVRGKTLNGMNGIDVIYALGGPSRTRRD